MAEKGWPSTARSAGHFEFDKLPCGPLYGDKGCVAEVAWTPHPLVAAYGMYIANPIEECFLKTEKRR